MLHQVAQFAQNIITSIGYPGLFLLIFLESTVVPIPSLLVMPFAGFLAAKGTFSLPLILLVNSIAALTGSLVSYAVGIKGGKPLLQRYGHLIFVKAADLERTETFFAKHGAWTILIARFIPVIRHIISLVAGTAKMPLTPFITQTVVGASAWGGGLMVVGYLLGAQWESVMKVAKRVDLMIALVIVLIIGGVGVRLFIRRRQQAKAGASV